MVTIEHYFEHAAHFILFDRTATQPQSSNRSSILSSCDWLLFLRLNKNETECQLLKFPNFDSEQIGASISLAPSCQLISTIPAVYMLTAPLGHSLLYRKFLEIWGGLNRSMQHWRGVY